MVGVVVLPLLQFLREEVGVVDDLAFEGSGLVIAEEEGWTSAKVGTLGEHLAGRAGMPWLSNGFAERSHDCRPGDAAMAGDGEGVAGVVVQKAQNLCIHAWSAVGPGQPVMGEIDLHLIGLLSGEANVGRLRFLRLRNDQPGCFRMRQIVASDTVN